MPKSFRISHWLLIPAVACSTLLGAALAGEAEVSFVEPEKFTDFKKGTGGISEGREAMMADLETHLERLAGQWLPAGQTLHLRFIDIDLAGRLLPGQTIAHLPGRKIPLRTSNPYQRIIEHPYPPYLHFDYRLVDAAGNEIAAGEERLVENSFLSLAPRVRQHDTSALPYEKALLDRWFRDRFGGQCDVREVPAGGIARRSSVAYTITAPTSVAATTARASSTL